MSDGKKEEKLGPLVKIENNLQEEDDHSVVESSPEKKVEESEIFIMFENLYGRIIECLKEGGENVDDLLQEAKELCTITGVTMARVYPDSLELYKNGHENVMKLEKIQQLLLKFIEYVNLRKALDLKADKILDRISGMYTEYLEGTE